MKYVFHALRMQWRCATQYRASFWMQTLAQPYFIPSSQMARISFQVAVWASRVWSHLLRISFTSI